MAHQTVSSSGHATISLGGDALVLESPELDRLLRSLRQLQSPAAASVAEELSAQRLTGQIQLRATEAELEALAWAIGRLRGLMRGSSPLTELLSLTQELRPQQTAALTRANDRRATC
jgi:hypothetical protein